MNQAQEWLDLFEQVSCFHCKMFTEPLWNKYPAYATDIWHSLAIFLEGYAFERQGKNPDYPYAAVDALFYSREQNNNIFNQQIINLMWDRFSELLNNQNLNQRNNPIYPSTNPDNLRIGNERFSLVEVVINNIPQQNTLATYLRNLINQTHNIQGPFNILTRIRGIGPKIASFYLRDLVYIMNIDLANIQNRNLLQPIDTWVKRTVEILTNDENMNNRQIGEWVVSNCLENNINPERVNMGMWFFCSQIVKSKYKLETILNNLNDARNLLQEYKEILENVVTSNLNYL